ncbi:matrix AAA peptidase interacting protein 1 [Phyllostomus discolor]|uniref:M-AAA protease-interacting protein 1, mitochondrial n=1 Tax=Phyllostomus discolor TaxID=89673 RepID=A0A6J2LC51_9CHIR|nr:m-AAA protease-interacting protein 1, mitochondrial [Phyllostomus discolor]KAF6114850.1 matrix AAA peptidase interacting protein 1 [Phyllostomus discolor]
MALAVRLPPRLLFCGSLPGGAARPWTSGAAEVRAPLAGLCCFCRRHHLGSRTAPFLSVTWVCAASPLPALGPQRPLLSPPGLAAALPVFPVGARRSYSTEEQPQQRQKTKMFILGFSNPINWIRTRIYAFLIWAYFDKEFNITEFSEGAKQAFAHVSKLLSECKFDLLEELVAKEVLQVLKEKVTSLPDNHKNALAADIDEIVYTSTGDISIYYDEKGRKFVSILMCFWYLTSANIPSETLSGASVFQVKLGDQNVETKQLLSASYEFHREFTQGVKPDWTISRIDHSKLLE